ncbi:MAG: sulfur-carrier protein [Thermoproteota archaeon]|nr:sulfur-carrier protein [Thermoproteota archaeon]
MKVTVRYLGPVRVLLNKKEEVIEVPEKVMLLELLNNLSELYGNGFKEEIFDSVSKRIREGLVVTINGITIGQLNGIRTELKEGDTITLLPFFAGGG